ncbi:MAG: prolyl oligopeptidase family serine peptidase [Planctomycetes bacterium]|nr:prolyl oligopeptidase family serine peptidase [Planctomycetota bacterium]
MMIVFNPLTNSQQCRASILAAILCSLLLAFTSRSQAADSEIKRFETPEGVKYGVWGKKTKKPAPILFALGGTIDSILNSAYFRQCGNELAEFGYLTVSIDISCHGEQCPKGQPCGLGGWSFLAAKGEDFVAESNKRLSSVLDHLIKTGVADPERIVSCGTSRGGFLAIHFAASDKRVKCALGFAPVTDLAALSEFRKTKEHPLVKKLSLAEQADNLAGRPVWIIIGDQDERVSTRAAYEVAHRITEASRTKKLPSRVQLHIMPEPRGHTTPRGASKMAAEWVQSHLAKPKQKTDKKISRHILFVDDHHVLYRSGTKRLFHPAKLNPSNPIVREDQPWEMAIGWTSISKNPKTGKFQLWYQAYAGGRDERKTHKCVVCYAESDDGIHFTKPKLGIHDFTTDRKPWAGHFKETNIVLTGDGGYGDRYANSVLYDPRDSDSAKRYKMLYTDFGKDKNGREWPGFFAAFSTDGIHWTKSQKNPLNKTAYGGRGLQPLYSDEVPYNERWDKNKNFLRKTWAIPLSMSDAADVIYDPNHGLYVAYGKSWIQGPTGGLAWKHAMARTESEDFVTWSKPQLISMPDDLDQPNTEFHTSPVFYYKGCYFCLNQILSSRGQATGNKADAMHIELMISRDGLHWDRPFRDQRFIASSEQDFSNGGIFTNSTPVFLEDEIRFYYGGYNSGTIGGGQKLTSETQQSGVGFAGIRLDRFAGIRPVKLSAQSTLKKPLQNIGQITLKPMSFKGINQISVNADATEGEIRVEVLNSDGYRMRGFSKEEAVVLSKDSLQHQLKWKASKISQLPPGKYMLRLHLNNAEVFAITLK